MFGDGWREHMEHEMGCASELQNAYSVSRLEWDRVDDSAKILEAQRAGKIVLVRQWTSYCPRTDAILGGNLELVQIFEPDAELPELEFNEEITLSYRYPAPLEPKREPISDDEIPF